SGLERRIRRVDGVIGAVDQRHREIDHGKAKRPGFEEIDDALLDRWNEIPRHHAAADAILEKKTRTARQGLDLEHDVAELAMPAGLALVAAALRRGSLDGLLIGDLWTVGVELQAVFRRELLHRDLQMNF